MFKHQYSIRSNTHKGTVQLWGELVLLRSFLPWTVVLLVREMLPFLHSHRLNSRDKQIVKWFLHQPLGIHRRHELTKLFSLCPLKKGVSVSNWEKKIYAQKHLQTCICMNKLVILIPLKNRRRKNEGQSSHSSFLIAHLHYMKVPPCQFLLLAKSCSVAERTMKELKPSFNILSKQEIEPFRRHYSTRSPTCLTSILSWQVQFPNVSFRLL